MRIQVFSDLHGECPNINYNADIIFSLGDNYGKFMLDLNDAANDIPVIAVLGNHDSRQFIKHYKNIKFLDFNAVKIKGLAIAGVPGCVTNESNSGELEYTVDQYRRKVNPLPKSDIVISHTIPDLIKSECPDIWHYGIPSLSKYINTQKPRLVLCGHIHKNLFVKCNDTYIAVVFKMNEFEM